MTIHERAVAALAHARAVGIPPIGTGTAHQRRLRAAMTRDVATLLGVPPEQVLVGDDSIRSYAATPGQLIIVYDPDDDGAVLRFIPEPGNTGAGGGAYLLLDACPGCSSPDTVREVPMLSVACLTDLALHPATPTDAEPDLDLVPVEFFDDPAHAPDCPLR